MQGKKKTFCYTAHHQYMFVILIISCLSTQQLLIFHKSWKGEITKQAWSKMIKMATAWVPVSPTSMTAAATPQASVIV
jgi:hypothetical protein